jgi:hypothetical protein
MVNREWGVGRAESHERRKGARADLPLQHDDMRSTPTYCCNNIITNYGVKSREIITTGRVGKLS